MKTGRYYWYIVHYGDALSSHKCPNWTEACAYMLYCLREGYKVRGVTMEPKQHA